MAERFKAHRALHPSRKGRCGTPGKS